MPLKQITREEQQAGLKGMEPDLGYLLHDRGVDEQLVALIGHSKVTRLNIFAKIERNEEAVRKWLEDDFGLKSSDGTEAKVLIAKTLDAWEAAVKRVRAQAEAESQARIDGRPKELMRGAHLALRRSFENLNGGTEEKYLPSRQLVDQRLDQIEEGEVKAEPLSDVVSLQKEEESDIKNTEVDVKFGNGSIKFKKQNLKTSPPDTPEQLRSFYKIIANHWMMVKLKIPGKSWLVDHEASAWEAHVSYLLGDDVWGLEAKSAGGQVVARPAWLQVLEYEFRLRKEAYKQVNNGVPLTEALKNARDSDSLKTRFLLTPMALTVNTSKAQSSNTFEPARDEAGLTRVALPAGAGTGRGNGGGGFGGGGRGNGGAGRGNGLWKGAWKGAGRGGGKGGNNKGGGGGGAGGGGNGGGSGKGGAKGVSNHFNRAKADPQLARTLKFVTADGQKICFRYNKGKCTQDQCQFVHVCAKCEGAHPYERCTAWAQ